MPATIETRLPKWVIASLAILLRAKIVDDLEWTFYVEGIDRETSQFFQDDSVVLRVVGPTIVFGGGQNRYKFEVMCLITDLVSDSHNRYQLTNVAAEIANELNAPVPVFQHPDSGTQAGCLDWDRDADKPLRIVPFGELDKDSEVTQSAIIAYYEICLDA
jgi:hypothetical protein